MDYEKKYKEDLEAAKGWLAIAKENHNKIAIQILEKFFPELKESEDEKIKKAIVEALSRQGYSENILENWGVSYNDAIAWLERQKPLNNFDEAEKEKNDFVSGQFIECRKSFNEFKEDNSYWLEYIGDDTYIGRSDNVLNQKFHITPRQLFTLFTHEHCPKENNDEQKENNWNDMIKNLDKVEEYVLSLAPNMPLDAVKVHAKNIRFWVNDGQKPKTTPQWMIDFLDEYRRKIGRSMDYDEIRDTDGKVLAIVNWLKDNQNIQQKPIERSEEDEDMIKYIAAIKIGDYYTQDEINKITSWLKSCKSNNWKPSEEQLNEVKNAIGITGTNGIVLLSLYNDLLKL